MNFEPIKPHTVIGFGLWNIIYLHCSIKTTYIHCIFIWFLWLYLLATQTMQSIDCRAFNYEILIFFAIFQKSSPKKWIALFCFHGVIYNIGTFVTHFCFEISFQTISSESRFLHFQNISPHLGISHTFFNKVTLSFYSSLHVKVILFLSSVVVRLLSRTVCGKKIKTNWFDKK